MTSTEVKEKSENLVSELVKFELFDNVYAGTRANAIMLDLMKEYKQMRKDVYAKIKEIESRRKLKRNEGK